MQAFLTFFGVNVCHMSILASKSPFELLHGTTPDYTNLRTIACLCFTANVGEKDKF